MYPIANASSFNALVVGRGAVGAATALGLARAGLRVGMVAPGAPEPAPHPGPDDWDPRVFALSPASRGLLQQLRVWDALDARRVAPVQVNFLGFAATMGADFMDYILVDPVLVPAGTEAGSPIASRPPASARASGKREPMVSRTRLAAGAISTSWLVRNDMRVRGRSRRLAAT